jgi:hypothetical protein
MAAPSELRQQLEVHLRPLMRAVGRTTHHDTVHTHTHITRHTQENEILEKCIYCADTTKFFTYEVSLPMASSMDLNYSLDATAGKRHTSATH